MAGGGNPKAAQQKPSSSSSTFSQRKSRWESGNKPLSDLKHGGSADPKLPKPSPIPKETLISQSADRNRSPGQHHLFGDRIPHPVPGVPNQLAGGPLPDPAGFGPPPPVYGFHMLDRRTIVLPDNTVRTYLALPQDYNDSPLQVRPLDPSQRVNLATHGDYGPDQSMPTPEKRFPLGFGRGGELDYWNSLGLDGKGGGDGILKRKFGDGEEEGFRTLDNDGGRDDIFRQRQQVLQHGNLQPNGFPFVGSGRPSHLAGTSSPHRRDIGEQIREDGFRPTKVIRGSGAMDNMGNKNQVVDPVALKKSYLYFAKLLNENASQKKAYLEDGKKGSFQCAVCGRSSKDFSTVHDLLMHTYTNEKEELRVDHLGLHKALCVLMGWNFAKSPDNSKTYQFLPAEEAEENQDDQIFWPPTVIVHNTITGKGKDGRSEGLGNKAMDTIFRELGFGNGKCKSQYNKEGHTGLTLVNFAASLPGLKEADSLEDYFVKEGRGRKGWAMVQPLATGVKDEKNPKLVVVDDKTGDKKRVLYGYVATASDLDKLEPDVKKKLSVESRRDYLSSMKL